MKTSLFAAALAAVCLSGAAVAQDTTIIRRDGPDVDKTVIHRDAPTAVITHDEGCASKTVKKTNEMGDSVSKTVSNC
jgi:hypothetical protein